MKASLGVHRGGNPRSALDVAAGWGSKCRFQGVSDAGHHVAVPKRRTKARSILSFQVQTQSPRTDQAPQMAKA